MIETKGYWLHMDNSNNLSKRTRIVWLDMAKGLGIMLVLLGHAPRDEMLISYPLISFIKHFIYLFHMPLFFFISGITFSLIKYNDNNEKVIEYLIKKLKRLVLPAIIYSLIIYFLVQIAWATPIKEILEKSSYKKVGILEYLYMTLFVENPYCIHVWYSLVLFSVEFIFFIVLRIFRKIVKKQIDIKFKLLTICFQGLCLLLLLFFYEPQMQYFKICKFFIYYLLGILTAPILVKHFRKLCFLLIPGVALCLFYVIEDIHVYDVVYYCICVPFMIVSICSLCIYYTNRSITTDKCFLKFAGEISFDIYLLHQPFCSFMGIILMHLLGTSILFTCVELLLSITLGIIFTIMISWILYNIPKGYVLAKILNIDNIIQLYRDRRCFAKKHSDNVENKYGK